MTNFCKHSKIVKEKSITHFIQNIKPKRNVSILTNKAITKIKFIFPSILISYVLIGTEQNQNALCYDLRFQKLFITAAFTWAIIKINLQN